MVWSAFLASNRAPDRLIQDGAEAPEMPWSSWSCSPGGVFLPAGFWMWGTEDTTNVRFTLNEFHLVRPEFMRASIGLGQFLTWVMKNRREHTWCPVEFDQRPPWYMGQLGWPPLKIGDQFRIEHTGKLQAAALFGIYSNSEEGARDGASEQPRSE